MNPEQVPREAGVIAAIDDLIDEQLRLGERWKSGDDRCRLCGGMWHGLPGDGPADYITDNVGDTCPAAMGQTATFKT